MIAPEILQTDVKITVDPKKHEAKGRDSAWAVTKSKGPPSTMNPQSVVRVFVNDGKTEFLIHEDFLCYYSPKFTSALHDESLRKTSEKCIYIECDNIESFKLLVHWLYTQEIQVEAFTDDPTATEEDKETKDKPSFNTLFALWISGQFLEIPVLQNHTMEVIHAKRARLNLFELRSFPYIYNNTSPGDLLRKYVVDVSVWRLYLDANEYLKYDLPKNILLDILMGLNDRCLHDTSRTPVCPIDDINNYLYQYPRRWITAQSDKNQIDIESIFGPGWRFDD